MTVVNFPLAWITAFSLYQNVLLCNSVLLQSVNNWILPSVLQNQVIVLSIVRGCSFGC